MVGRILKLSLPEYYEIDDESLLTTDSILGSLL